MLRGRGHLPHRPSRCFPAARSQLHRLWTRRELEKTKEPRRNHVRVHRRRFEYRTENRLIQNWKIITRFSTEREIKYICLHLFFKKKEKKKYNPFFQTFVWIYLGLGFNPSRLEHVSQSHRTPWAPSKWVGIVATCATLANPKDWWWQGGGTVIDSREGGKFKVSPAEHALPLKYT